MYGSSFVGSSVLPSAAHQTNRNPLAIVLPSSYGHSVAVRRDAHLSEVIDIFRGHPDLRILAVVDAGHRPIGLIREQRVRELLFCPYWFSLIDRKSTRLNSSH